MIVWTGGRPRTMPRKLWPWMSELVKRARVLLRAESKSYWISPLSGAASAMAALARNSLLFSCGTTMADARPNGSAKASPTRPERNVQSIVHPTGGRGVEQFIAKGELRFCQHTICRSTTEADPIDWIAPGLYAGEAKYSQGSPHPDCIDAGGSMKRTMRIPTFIALIVAIAIVGQTAPAQSREERAIRAASDAWQRYIREQKVDSIVGLFTSDAVFMLANSPPTKGSVAL